MFRQKYFALPINEDFQPIQIELQNYQQKRDVDFKLIVLLILIIMLGILIRKEQEQLQMQTLNNDNKLYLRRETVFGEYNQQRGNVQYISKVQTHQVPNLIVIQQNRFPKQETNTNQKSININPQLIHIKPSQTSSEQKQQKKKQQLSQPGNREMSNNYKSIHIIQRTIQIQPKPIHKPTNNHSQLLKKYIEFYMWFPFFIFALIVYSCYEKQSSQNSILISVKTLNQGPEGQEIGECAICINEISRDDPLAVLPCSRKHIFHSRCIKEWLPQKKTCPICRSDVRKFKNLQK